MIERGKNHLIYETQTHFTFELFAEFDKHGIPCICLTTKLPRKLKKEYNLKKAEFIWLSDPADPKVLTGEVLKSLKKFMKDHKECIVMIDEVEYLILENGYDVTEEFLSDLGKYAAKNGSSLIVPLNPGSINEEISSALARKFDQIKDVRNIMLTGNKLECPECGAMWHTDVDTCDICGYEFKADHVKPSLESDEKVIPSRHEAKISGKLKTKNTEEPAHEEAIEEEPEKPPKVEEPPVKKSSETKKHMSDLTKDEISAYDFNTRPDDDSWFNRGVALEKMGKSEQAVECFDMALEENPNDSWAWFNKGVSLHRLGLLGEALLCYDKSLELNPSDADLMSNKGILLRTLGKTDEAIIWYRKALEISPKDPGIWSNLGVTYRVLGNNKDALECYDKALKLDSMDIGVWLNKAALLQSEGKFDEAIQCYEEVLKINPYHPVALRNKEFAITRTLRS